MVANNLVSHGPIASIILELFSTKKNSIQQPYQMETKWQSCQIILPEQQSTQHLCWKSFDKTHRKKSDPGWRRQWPDLRKVGR